MVGTWKPLNHTLLSHPMLPMVLPLGLWLPSSYPSTQLTEVVDERDRGCTKELGAAKILVQAMGSDAQANDGIE
jgi:hypothetical protein